jgi:hypothetical protein
VPMSSARPSPDGLEESMINVVKDLKARPHGGERVPTHESSG